MMKRPLAVLAVLALGVGGLVGVSSAGADPAVDATVRLNQIQTVGSHNSYHQRSTQAEYEIREEVAPAFNLGLDYEHPALGLQFSAQRVRQIELDIFADPAGGLYSEPLIRAFAGEGPLPPADKAVMDAPGIKVLHAQDVDYRSNCLTLVVCLEAVKTWSDAHPTHAPIAILLELKEDEIPVVPAPPAVKPLAWTAANIGDLDAEIDSVFPSDRIIRPDDVRGSYATVNEGALAGNWPTLADARGKVMFLMDNANKRSEYLTAYPGLHGAAVFTNASPGQPDAAFVKMNDPTGTHTAEIADLVAQGYVVRTRADGDTLEARTNDTSQRDAAFASGAQWVSTDYPSPGSADYLDSPYFAALPSGTTARCNPVNGPDECVDAVLDTVPVEALPPGALGTPWIPVGEPGDDPSAPDPDPSVPQPSTPDPSAPDPDPSTPDGHGSSGGGDRDRSGGHAPVARPVSASPTYTG